MTQTVPILFGMTSGIQRGFFLPSKYGSNSLSIQLLKTVRLIANCVPLSPSI